MEINNNLTVDITNFSQTSALATVSRGPIIESVHYGHVAVTDGNGKLIAYAGNPNRVSYMRSSAKPIQALNVVLSGAAEKFGFNNKELAITCSSHYGEDIHKDVIFGLLKKLNLPLSALLCGSPLSISANYQKVQLKENHVLNPSNSDCSGKHCGFLSVCLTKGYPIENYNSINHPMQREILSILSDFTDVPANDIPIGVDGCGVPVHAFKLRDMAKAYARFSNPDNFSEKYRNGCKKLFSAINAHPEMMAGTNGFCTEFLKNTHGRFVAKLGAEGVYCIGVKDKDIGIAVKIDDGNTRALYPVVMSVLKQLDLLSAEESEKLKGFAEQPVMNNLGNPVGKTEAVVTLRE